LITLVVIFVFIRTYREIKSRFNLGLVIFSLAMLIQIIASASLDIVIHLVSEIFELAALIIFLSLIRK